MAVGSLRELRIAVLYGGPGAEREVSLVSGAAIADALAAAGFAVERVDVSGAPGQIRDLACDLAFLALHGEFGEDGTVQMLLDSRGIPFTGSAAAACALTIDKAETKLRLRAAGLPTPAWTLAGSVAAAAPAMERAGLALPVVVKPVSRGSSVGVTIVRRPGDLREATELALSFDRTAMIEEFVAGRELTAGMLGNEALPLVELKTARAFYDYEAKYRDERTGYLCPAPLDGEQSAALQELCLQVNQTLGVEHLARVDIMLGQAGPMVLEVNTIPGFTSHSLLPMAAKAAGVNFSGLCERILQLAWDRHRRGAEPRKPEEPQGRGS